MQSRVLSERDRTRFVSILQEVFEDFKPINTRKVGTRKGQESIAIGINRRYSSHVCSMNVALFQKPGMLRLVEALGTWADKHAPAFRYTSIQINKNYPGNLHVDRSNAGASLMLTVGGKSLRGGELWCNGQVLPTANRFIAFDGNDPHVTLPYRGTRYSVILFTFSQLCTNAGDGSIFREARALGLRPPASARSVCKMMKAYEEKRVRLERARVALRKGLRAWNVHATFPVTRQWLEQRMQHGHA